MRDVLGNAQSSPLIRRFGVAAENLLRNPAFDAGLDGTWEVIAPNAADIRHLAQDASSEASGMVIVDPVGNPGDRFQLSQCVEVDGGTPYVLGGLGLIDSSDTAHPTLKVMVRYFRNLGCTSHLETTEATLATGSTHWEWTPRLFMGSSAPAEALSARVTFAVVGGTSEPFTAYLDETALFENVFFVDGFESGDTGWWETQVP